MYKIFKAPRLVMLTVTLTMAGCAGTPPSLYSGIDSSARLAPNTEDDSGRVPYSYKANVDWNHYSAVILEPVTVYQAPDNQFGDLTQADRQTLARYMHSQFSERLKERFKLTRISTPNTLRVKLTLTGAQTTTPFLGTFTRFDLAGGPYNIVQSIRGKEGTFTGSVFFSVEIYDAATNRLLNAYVTKQYPNSLNIGATRGSLSAAQTGIDKGAEALVAQFK
ncbi:DUF3313 domain-containing protein [Pseudomonas gingeri]|uniref:DUF3313 domain-containing protein n=1 Tax=Pseudomonas gingeri TaxID=117681 RepID=A0A7Y8C2C9_9PSED|nr:DUF3313 domain-containing protein [Pseudomonas gingeri]NWA24395.1 DUF3313 domain-containing protein [Pseudomonas gingeri]NWB96993.1 DUF3313 domain-containing protein [Pseudomonas gingeri]NWD73686.1 DUF3313 domain-containing protein [Pseudomonas gingeri]